MLPLRRSACSGCHNIVPSQRQLEIRRNNKIFTCEYCGRILISQEIADEVEASLNFFKMFTEFNNSILYIPTH
ncbi:MAG: C4-type zinc ribbon domain-containing protein [Ignavibacteriales bacterium]|nr:C4-type zinc ribbon domain-containing protein [Ignavibacteriales bacterium]